MAEILTSAPRIEGILTFGRPFAPLITGDGEGEAHAGACLLSPQGHVAVFDLTDHEVPDDH